MLDSLQGDTALGLSSTANSIQVVQQLVKGLCRSVHLGSVYLNLAVLEGGCEDG